MPGKHKDLNLDPSQHPNKRWVWQILRGSMVILAKMASSRFRETETLS